MDGSGKSTQCKKLAEVLENTVQHRYPDRSTQIGTLISEYLKSNVELNDFAVHLLFSANRWELSDTLISQLNSGKTVITDRYAYSGVAFTAAKQNENFTIERCMEPDRYLPKPDRCYYLTEPTEVVQARGDFGAERYEKVEFQKRAQENFQKLIKLDNDADLWRQIDATGT